MHSLKSHLVTRKYLTHHYLCENSNNKLYSQDIQDLFTKQNESYSQMLKLLNLPSLELRRLHKDLIWCYKIIFDIVELACNDFFKLSPSSVTRDHAYKLYKPDSTSAARSHFFACPVINAWNSLPPSTDFRNINVFKHSLFTAGLTKFLVGNT